MLHSCRAVHKDLQKGKKKQKGPTDTFEVLELKFVTINFVSKGSNSLKTVLQGVAK